MIEYSTKAEIMKGLLEIVKLLRENNKLMKEIKEQLKRSDTNDR
ncbi:MAG: hypothetical protein U0M02_13930 [Acutalibacteraceae bacterium]|nr:hypothetical protein [Acutalibacteraceae bacterium]